MPNWKNRPMMMKSGGSVNQERLIDLAKRLQEKRVNFGPLYSNKKSRGARFGVRDGVLDLIQDKESGKKSLKYSRGPASLEAYTDDPYAGSGVKGNITLRFSKGGPVQGFAQGGQANRNRNRRNIKNVKPDYEAPTTILGIEKLLNNPITDDQLISDAFDINLTDMEAFGNRGPGPGQRGFFSSKDGALNAIGKAKIKEQRIRRSLQNIDKEIIKMQERIKNQSSYEKAVGNNYPQIRLEQLLEEKAKLSGINPELSGFNFDLNKGLVTDPSELLNIKDVDITLPKVVEKKKSITDIDVPTIEQIKENIKKASEAPEEEFDLGNVVSETDMSDVGTDINKNEIDASEENLSGIEAFRQELMMRDDGSYSPEAQRAGQVASMYGQVSPGQVGGFGVAEARGAAAAEGVQQKIDADTRASVAAIDTAVAKEKAKLDGTGAYESKPIELSLGKLGGNPYMVKAYVPKNQDGSGNERLATGQAANVVREVVDATKGLQNTVSILDYLSENADKATGGPAAGVALLNDALSFIGLSPSLSGRQEADALVDFQNLIVAKPLLGEGGKTISDNERQMVKNAIGQASAFKSPAVLRARIREIKNKMVMSLRQHRNFLQTNAAQFDEINESLNNYLGQENMAGTNLTQTQYKKGNDGIFRRVK
tara:strand:- start:655 stop:2616 length:1962 start_codon:yes stop_codon:yes gene_type:complete